MIGRTIGRFVVLEKLGEGGMATVWKARDTLLDRVVALKVITPALASDPTARRRFHHEAELVSRLDHPHIAPVFASGTDDGVTYLAMSCIDGETLHDRLLRGLLPIAVAVDMARAAADALGFAHDNGIIHRDVSSRNIMLGRDGRVFVVDFGLATATDISRVTSRNSIVGTLAYMAPELMSGHGSDAISDLYSLGVVLYEALTGALPFEADVPEVLRYAAINQTPMPIRERRPEVSAELECVTMKAIARDRSERQASMSAFSRDLEGLSEITSEDDSHADSSPGARALGGHGPIHLAVLPIRWNEHSEELDAAGRQFASDLEGALRDSLARAGRTHVVPADTRSASLETMLELRSFARDVGAQVLLQGSLRRRGSLLRFGYALVDPEAEVRIAGGTLSGSLAESFDFEDRIIAHICGHMGRDALPEHRIRGRSKHPAAEHRFAQALACLKRFDSEASVDGAIHLLEELIATDGSEAKYHAALARAALRKQEYTQMPLWEGRAALACQRAIELDPGAAEVQLALGEIKRAAGKHEAALKAFERALDARTTRFEAMLGTARTQAEAGRMEEAEAAAQRAIADQPEDWRGHNLLGWIHVQNGRPERAVESQRRVLELTPDNARGLRNLGTAFYRLGDFDGAIDAYRRSLEIQPSHIGFSNLGAALYFVGDYDDALDAMRKAADIAPSFPRAWGNFGNACHWIGGHEAEARDALERAIGLMRERLDRTPGDARGWAEMSGWLANLGQLQEAERVIQHALELAPSDGEVMARAGFAFHSIGNRAECFRWLRGAKAAGYGLGELARSLAVASLQTDPEFISLIGDLPHEGVDVRDHRHKINNEGGRS